MSPRTEKQFENIREEKMNLIMNVALELFADEGFHGTTISKIAQEAGISKGLLYNYFESKDDLIRKIIYSGLDDIDKFFDPDKDGILTSEELAFAIDKIFDLMKEEIHFWKLYFTLVMQKPVLKLVEDRLQEIVGKYISMMAKYFESRNCDDPETEALIFGAMLDGVGMHFISNSDNFPIERVKKRLIELYTQ